MKTHRARLRLHLPWVALLALMLAAGPALTAHAAQADATPSASSTAAKGSVAAYRSATRLKPSAFGPAKGSLTHDAQTIATAPAGISVFNFYATVRVTAPYDGADNLWDAGFLFRVGRDSDWRVVVYSDGTWDARVGSADPPAAKGTVPGFKDGAGESDTIELAVDGGTAYLAVNGDEVGSFDVTQREVAGDVSFGITFADNTTQVGAKTPYSRFQVWELPDAGPTVEIAGDDQDLLEQARDEADTGDPLGGPRSDDLTETPDSVTIDTLGITASDLYVKAEVENPRAGSTTPFDIGFGFRDAGGDAQYRLIFASDGTWYVKYGLEPAIAADRFEGFKDGAGERNLFELAASGDRLVFAVNGETVGAADISAHADAGDVAIGVGFYGDVDVVDGDTTSFTEFSAWKLTGSATGEPTKRASAAATVDEEPTDEPAPTRRATRVPTEEAEPTDVPTEEAEPTEAPTEAAVIPASDDPADIFAAIVDNEDQLDILYGPKSGELEQTADSIAYANTKLDVADFVAHVDFTNPYAASEADWDIGVLFRVGQDDPHLRLIVSSTGDWYLTPSSDDPIQQGKLTNLKTRANQHNTLDLVVIGDTGYFGVNGEFVDTLDLSTVTQSGDIAIGTSFFEGAFQAGAVTAYADFTVWEADASLVAPRPSGKGSPTPTSGKKTPTTEAGTGYESPTYGYTIAYDDPWTIADQSSEKGVDYVRFGDGTATVDVSGYESDLTPQECLDDEFDYYQSADGYSAAEIAKDTDKEEMTGKLRGGGVYGVYWFTFTPQGEDATDYTAYVECHQLAAGTLLKIVQFVPFDDYNDEIDNRVALLKGLDLDGSGGTTTTTKKSPTAEPEEDVTPEATGTPEDVLASAIESVDNSGVQGFASIGKKNSRVEVIVIGIGTEDGQVAVIQKGTCSDLPGKAAFELKPFASGVSDTLIKSTLDDLRTGYVITIHASADDLSSPVACGEIFG